MGPCMCTNRGLQTPTIAVAGSSGELCLGCLTSLNINAAVQTSRSGIELSYVTCSSYRCTAAANRDMGAIVKLMYLS